MKAIKAFLMCFSMFCAIPCPIRFWDNSLRPLMTAMLPAVGLVIGLIWTLAAFLCEFFDVPPMLAAMALTVLPWLLSGYMHLDGFMDSCDAILSRRDLEERRRILKDPLTGSFAVICIVILALVCFAAFAEADLSDFWALAAVPVITRGLSAIAVQILKPISHSQYAKTDHPAYAAAIPAVWVVLALAFSVFIGGRAWLCALGAGAGWCAACFNGYRQLDGMSGDISGYAITIGEACAAVMFAFV